LEYVKQICWKSENWQLGRAPSLDVVFSMNELNRWIIWIMFTLSRCLLWSVLI
jgi:hypothetical protein